MSQPTTPQGDLFQILTSPPVPRCWYCSHPHPHGTAQLGGSMGNAAPIAVCADGEGCEDGRIFHGPSGPKPHLPDEACERCGPVAGRAIPRGRTNPSVVTARNRSRRHTR